MPIMRMPMRTDPERAQLAVLLTRKATTSDKIASMVEIRVADRLLREGRISPSVYEQIVSASVGKVASRFYASPPPALRRAHRTVLRRLLSISNKRVVEVA